MKLFWQQKYIFEILVASTIIVLPFSIYLHLLFDDSAEYLNFLGHEIHHIYGNNEIFVWYFLSKLVPLTLLTIWFLTNPYWWRYFIFAPLILWMDSLARNTFLFGSIIENNLEVFSFLINAIIIGLLVMFQQNSIGKSTASTVFGSKKSGLIQKYPTLHKAIDREARSLSEAKQVLAKKEYLRKLMVMKTFINNSLEQPASESNGSRPKGKWDLLIVVLLIFTPFLLYSYKFIPENVQDYKVLWFTIHSHGFVDVNAFFWFVCLKLGTLLPMVIWFVTAKDWWRYAILSPIVLMVYQLFESFANYEITDETSFFKALPLTIGIVFFLGWIVHIIRHKTKVLELYEGITQEIEEMLSTISSHTEMFSEKEAEFKDLKENAQGIKEKQRIDLLKDLREELLKEYIIKNRL